MALSDFGGNPLSQHRPIHRLQSQAFQPYVAASRSVTVSGYVTHPEPENSY